MALTAALPAKLAWRGVTEETIREPLLSVFSVKSVYKKEDDSDLRDTL